MDDGPMDEAPRGAVGRTGQLGKPPGRAFCVRLKEDDEDLSTTDTRQNTLDADRPSAISKDYQES